MHAVLRIKSRLLYLMDEFYIFGIINSINFK